MIRFTMLSTRNCWQLETGIRQGNDKNFEMKTWLQSNKIYIDIYSKPVSIFSNKHPRRLFKFEVLRLQRLFQNKKNHLYETSKPCHGLFSNNNKWLASYIYLFCTCSMHFGLVTITVRFLQGSLFEGWVPLIRRKHLLKEGAYMSVKPYGAH